MIKSIFRLKNELIVTLEDGTAYRTRNCTNELFEAVNNLYGKEDIKSDLDNLFATKEEKEYNKIKKSSILTIKNDSAYMPEISNLTIPQMLASKIADAEEKGDEDAITAYKNFWTLLSLNPNSAVRENLFWFLDKWGMSISKAGLVVAYRNVDLKQEGTKYNQELTTIVSKYYNYYRANNIDPKSYVVLYKTNGNYVVCTKDDISDEVVLGNLAELYANVVFTDDKAGTVYTDNHTHTFEIRLGHIVSMPRSECDETQVSCSRGLHGGSRGWLKENYCGNIGIKILINPCDIVSVPREDNYGKLRCCAYYPLQIISFNDSGDVDDEILSDGFEVDFLNKISYTGTINNEDNDNYKLNIPKRIAKKNVENIYATLRETANKINRRV